MKLIDRSFLEDKDIFNTIDSLLQYSDIAMLACFNISEMKMSACNRSFAKNFRISLSEKSEVFLDNILHYKGRRINPVISHLDERPVSNIVYRYNDPSPLECYFYEYDKGRSLLMYLQLQEPSELDLVEKMSATTADIARVTLELRKKNQELHRSRNTIVNQARTAAIGDIIQMLAHQWRQPLAALNSKVATMKIDFMIDDPSKDDTLDGLSTIEEITQELSSMINDFRTLYETDTELKETPLLPLINKAISLLKVSLDESSIEVDVECPPHLTFRSLEAELLQCLIAIVKNSIEAFTETPSATPFIHITAKEEEQKVLIMIRDNAGGIEEDDLTHVFDPYFSTKSNTTKGLGLYVVQTIVTEKMQGEITLQNRENGLTTTLILPHS